MTNVINLGVIWGIRDGPSPLLAQNAGAALSAALPFWEGGEERFTI